MNQSMITITANRGIRLSLAAALLALLAGIRGRRWSLLANRIGYLFVALAVALFQHAYIWVHYYCTEKPDMRRIYG